MSDEERPVPRKAETLEQRLEHDDAERIPAWKFRRFQEWFVPQGDRSADAFAGRPLRAPGA